MAQAIHEGADEQTILEAVPELQGVPKEELEFRYIWLIGCVLFKQ